MLSFGSDNHSGVHPKIWEALAAANAGHAPSYGTDETSLELESLIGSEFGAHYQGFLVFNGTAANVMCLKSLLKSHEAVICAETAHLNLDECAAPESVGGFKVLTCPTENGKISPGDCEKYLIRAGDQHYAQPRVVSLTQPTEYGTMYSLAELQEWRRFTRERNLLFHIDGARLIYAARGLGSSLKDAAGGADAISFGGTKNGLLFGELVLLKKEFARDAKFTRKQLMQLPSKSRFVAAQFLALLRPPGLWRDIADHGHAMARRLEDGLRRVPGVRITQEVAANSVFAVFPRSWVKPLKTEAFFYVWDEKTFEVRLMMSFDVTENDVDRFVERCRQLAETNREEQLGKGH